MQASHYVAIAIRIFAICLALNSIPQMGMLIEALRNGGTISSFDVSYVLQALSVIVPLIVALTLWIFPSVVAGKIVKPEIDKPAEPIQPLAILTVVVVSLGLFVLSYAVPDMLYWSTIVGMTQQAEFGEPAFSLGKEGTGNVLATVAELLIGLGLVFKGRTVSEVLFRVAR
ncbi:hypothetical protein CF392_09545 [Tamilnaduibacter salinus]|uniref:Uncharacterized protein n=2 Tax=Tamilnaduibacter salinus TaxID=1484056 RepID=A0A2A2I3S4_9GAMM|nr:hypothetical protein CF392_09545 [Tamilnaduibacter salinus]